MAAKKRKIVRSTPKKAVKKPVKVIKKATLVKSKAAKTSKTKTKAVVKKSTPVKSVRQASISTVDKAFTKGQLFTTLAACTGVQRKEVASIFDELSNIVAAHLKKQGPGQFTLPGLLKVSIKNKPATKARKGVNPFNGEEMMFKAKPARNVVKIRPLQKLKAMA